MAYYKSTRFKSGNRVYQTEVGITSEGIKSINYEEDGLNARVRMSASQVYRIERYVSGNERLPYSIPSKKESERIIAIYGLEKIGSIYKGNANMIYNILREKYPDFNWKNYHNSDGKGYKRLAYAVTYGDAPCKIINPAKTQV